VELKKSINGDKTWFYRHYGGNVTMCSFMMRLGGVLGDFNVVLRLFWDSGVVLNHCVPWCWHWHCVDSVARCTGIVR